ncbi:uncharacterized protein [Medicago truncatula]|uniref:uncharacterized protein n=1 Tax=Medicago truncatula TaxID=3880 RepID=UPI0019670A74|nr:uncharacterized protein LOC120577841 [Medicago truncatula]
MAQLTLSSSLSHSISLLPLVLSISPALTLNLTLTLGSLNITLNRRRLIVNLTLSLPPSPITTKFFAVSRSQFCAIGVLRGFHRGSQFFSSHTSVYQGSAFHSSSTIENASSNIGSKVIRYNEIFDDIILANDVDSLLSFVMASDKIME